MSAALEELADRFEVQREDRLDYSAVRFRAAPGAVDVAALRAAGLHVEVEVRAESWRATADGLVVEDNGLAPDVFDRPTVDRVEGAVAGNDVVALLAAVADDDRVVADFLVAYEHRAVDSHWARTTDVVLDLLRRPTRLAAAERLLAPPVTVVADMGAAAVATVGIRIGGPDAPAAAPTGDRSAAALLPDVAEPDGPLVAALRQVAAENMWADMATGVGPGDGDTPLVRFEGARVVVVPLVVPVDAEQAAAVHGLWQWATPGREVDRLEAVQQATALAVQQEGDLPDAATRVLPTARSIFNLARRGLVAEALQARRAARDAARQAATSAATAASEAAAKTRDRVLVQLGAAAGVAVARATEVVDRGVAIGLLALLAVVIVAVSAVGWALDLRAAREMLRAFGTDLSDYSEALSPTDVDEINQLAVVRTAHAHADRAATAIVVTGAVGLVLAAVAILAVP